MNKEFNFTEARIKTLNPPAKGRVCYKDTKEKGLSLYVTASGTVTFFVRKRINHKDERVILGNYPAMPVEEARSAALNARAIISKGQNPNDEKKKIRNESTFEYMFDRYINDYAKHHTKSWQHDIEDINRNLSSWFKRKISSITTEEIRKLHAAFGAKRGIYGANRLLDRINAIYNKAIEWGWEGKNPASGVKKFKMKSRDRFLTANELPALFESLAEEENLIARDYILISLLTGARKGNVLTMCWKDIDFYNKTWRISETKNGDSLTVPLMEQAIAILQERKKENTKIVNSGDFVFPGVGVKGYLADPKKTWKRVCQNATIKLWRDDKDFALLVCEAESGLPAGSSIMKLYRAVHIIADEKKIFLPVGISDVRIHDLRRTLGSWQAATGATTVIIGKSLGHKTHQATAIYARLNLDPVRESVSRATSAMFSAALKK